MDDWEEILSLKWLLSTALQSFAIVATVCAMALVAGAVLVFAFLFDKTGGAIWDVLLKEAGIFVPRVVCTEVETLTAVGESSYEFQQNYDGGSEDSAWALLPAGVQRWRGLLEETALRHGFDPLMFGVIATIENPAGNPTAGSWAGAQGLVQVMPFNFTANETDHFDPATNLEAGARVFASCLRLAGGDFRLAGACYNAGPRILRMNLANWFAETLLYYRRSAIYDEIRQGRTNTLDSWLGGHGGAVMASGAEAPSATGATTQTSQVCKICLVPNPNDGLLGFLGTALELLGLGPSSPCSEVSASTYQSSATVVAGGNGSWRYPVEGATVSDGPWHKIPALDFMVSLGTPVVSAHTVPATVEYSGCNNAGGYGCWVLLMHDDGKSTVYVHLDESLPVKTGDRVDASTLLGRVGLTGKTSGPHLHFEVREGLYNHIDPAEVFGEIGKGGLK
ncbi:peptidoglycan DD-metalloendopeptidase family protein [Candidatus Parcubacteria bacterium]|nr:peptidoglycan DD-metalloendopeptidase family protein [Patescibacteria group bacterium]MCG2689118.1 peptidoglycan DD-metalloendopeptidase family protein [Candidatus Parcubacteria bacterium]